MEALLEYVHRTGPAYEAHSAAERAEAFAAGRQKAEQRFRLGPGEQPCSRDELLQALGEWKKRGRLDGEKYAKLSDASMLAVAQPEDIPLLLDVRARILERVSDEALSDAQHLTQLLQRLGRSRYRREVGLTAKAEAK